MKICIAGGKNEADFLIGMLLKKKHKLMAINENPETARLISEKHGLPVYCGDPCKPFVLEEAGVKGCDIIIALTDADADNLLIGQLAKKQFGVKKAICLVDNPKNVEVFRKLGINMAISAMYMIAEMLEHAISVEDIKKN